MSGWDKLSSKLHQDIHISSLVFFRIAFGGILLWEVWRYFDHGWIAKYWIRPDFFFSYPGFSWLAPLPGDGMYILFYGLGLAALCIMLGLLYRPAAVIFFLGFTYIFLLDKTNYLNHFYLISLLSFLMIFMPANRAFSLDTKLGRTPNQIRIPLWTTGLIAFQVGVAYFFGGVAKLNADWLQGYPLYEWLGEQQDFPVLGPFFGKGWMVLFFSYSGLLLDLLIVPALLWKRTRMLAYLAIVSFHLLNHSLWQIGIFPWFMIAATTIFFHPTWFHKTMLKMGIDLFPEDPDGSPQSGNLNSNKYVTIALALYIAVQTLVPLRHFLIPGNVSWHEAGHRFAWHMKLRDKSARCSFIVKDLRSHEIWEVDNSDYLSRRQRSKMSTRPDMILQFAHYLEQVARNDGYGKVAVHVKSRASLNGRAYQSMIYPEVDLLHISRSTPLEEWIVPLTEGLRPWSNQGSP